MRLCDKHVDDIRHQGSQLSWTVVVLQGGWGWNPPPNLLCPTSWYYAWTIQNFINVLIFRVRPRACYDDEEAEDLTSWVSSDCTRTHLRGPRIKKKKFWVVMPPNSPKWSAHKYALTHTYSRYLIPPNNSVLKPPLLMNYTESNAFLTAWWEKSNAL